MPRFFSKLAPRARTNTDGAEQDNSGDLEKGVPSSPPDEPPLDDIELESEDEDDNDHGILEDDNDNEDEDDNDHTILEEDHDEPSSANATTRTPIRRRGTSSGISLFTARSLSIDFRYRPRRGPPQWWVKLKAFLYPPDPQDTDDTSSFVPNYRYTPIFSAVLIPFAILLEIPGLTSNWYIRTVNNETVEKRPNPLILDIGLGLSMACALLANMALITRFLERNIRLMTLLVVVFLTIHGKCITDIINITAVTIFGVEHRFDDGFTYGQSFWITLCSTIVSTITNATVIIDFVKTPDFVNSGSGLTRKQRSLVIVVIIMLVYIAFGALIVAILLKLNFIDALYFIVCAIEAIGFGDIVPVTTGSKVFICFYSVFGVLNLVLVVSLTRETVLEALELGYRNRVHAARVKRRNLRWQKRVAHRWRQAVEWRLKAKGAPLFVMNTEEFSGVWGFIRHSALRFVDWTFPQWTWRTKWKGLGGVAHPKGMHLNLEALEGHALEGAAMEAGVPLTELLPPGFAERWIQNHPPHDDRRSGASTPTIVPGVAQRPIPVSRDNSHLSTYQFGSWIARLQNAQVSYDPNDIPLTHARLGRMIAMLGGYALAVDRSGALKGTTTSERKGINAFPSKIRASNSGSTSHSKKANKSLSQQYDAYRVAMEKEETKAFYARLVVVWTLFVAFWMFGSLVFMATEGWSFGISMYFCVIAFATIGFGDYSPKTPAGRSIFVGWALLGVATMTILISVVAEAYTSRYKTVLQSTRIFDRAVSKYQAREKANASTNTEKRTHGSHSDVLYSTQKVEKQLEELPQRILNHARLFHEHLQYFVGPGSDARGHSSQHRIPESLTKLMDDIAGASKFGEKIQTEILQDKEARQTLFTLSIEKTLRKMIEAAEEAKESLAERDRLLAMYGELEDSHILPHNPPVINPNAQVTEVPRSELRFLTNNIQQGLPRGMGR
ncbi:hypothetical protein BDP27DRAFT_1226488 [Rhodocollybia butyracea]|uniref:Potassium channel domain-containing protein n=1 Tax=Rhodocollybia butyracea TaxID=206335 RepID=A0A9P5U5K4_9AGAR|nr:hypothetical protein BDP27DRAFT_1226488 [Rhodocollybia butyracea]